MVKTEKNPARSKMTQKPLKIFSFGFAFKGTEFCFLCSKGANLRTHPQGNKGERLGQFATMS